MSAKYDLLEAPCKWCEYNGKGYWQAGTHDKDCPWHSIGGGADREAKVASTILMQALEIRDLKAKLKSYEKSVTSSSVDSRYLQNEQRIKELKSHIVRLKIIVDNVAHIGYQFTDGQVFDLGRQDIEFAQTLLDETPKQSLQLESK
ncbi:hypothetical protein KAR91_46405 [Candidatus Pacearchaeota archaeon]|nr:hypothetical protein [Candidatus Pacearchaeota archaeon]